MIIIIIPIIIIIIIIYYYYYYIYIAFLEETVHILSPSQVVIMWFYILDSWTIFK